MKYPVSLFAGGILIFFHQKGFQIFKTQKKCLNRFQILISIFHFSKTDDYSGCLTHDGRVLIWGRPESGCLLGTVSKNHK